MGILDVSDQRSEIRNQRRSDLRLLTSDFCASQAAIAAPPGRLVLTLVAAGPFCLRALNQKAVNHTTEPGGVSSGKVISIVVREVIPSKSQAVSSAGGVAPTKL